MSEGVAERPLTGVTYPACSTVGMVKVNRAPRPGPSLSAHIRPPWASTIPLQTARPRPVPPPCSPESTRENFLNRWGRLSAGMPRPSSETATATWTPSTAALTRMGEDSGEFLAALESRLPSTCTMRARSAITQGRSSASSTST